MRNTIAEKDNFLQELATVQSYLFATSELISTTMQDHLERTVDGAIEEYKKRAKCDEKEAAFWWMHDHYDSITAAIRAAMYLSDTAHEATSQLWDRANSEIDEQGNREAAKVCSAS